MKIVIKTTNLKLDSELKNYIQEKIGGLEKFAKVFQEENYFERSEKQGSQRGSYFERSSVRGKARVEVWVEVGKTTLHHQKGDIFRAEAQMHLPEKSLRAEAEREDLKLAITEVKDELQRELKQYKGKTEAITKRRSRFFKKLLRLSLSARFKKRKGGRTREEGI